jgi:hypothetical protein
MFAPFRMNHKKRARQQRRHEGRKISSRAENRPEQAQKATSLLHSWLRITWEKGLQESLSPA